MYQPTTRLLTVLELLQAHPSISDPELAARLEVDVRSVRRYILMLQDLGIPVEAVMGRNGGYQLRPGYKLPPLMFDQAEVAALTLGLLITKNLSLQANSTTVQRALAKIERVLPEPLRAQAEALHEVIEFNSQPTTTTVTSPTLAKFSLGASQTLTVSLNYTKAAGNSTERLFDPYGLTYHDGFWYTAGYCHLRCDLRILRLDRVNWVELTEAQFTRPPAFNCSAYIMATIAAIPDRFDIEVILSMTLDAAQAKIPPMLANLTLAPSGEGVVLRAQLSDLNWLARFLVCLNCRLKIAQPTVLKTALHALGQELIALAQE